MNSCDTCSYQSFDYNVTRWAVIRTGARWEKKIAESLFALEVPVFLPIVERVTKYKTRISRVSVPLLSGYLFFDESHYQVLGLLSDESKRFIAQVLRTNDTAGLYADLCKIADLCTNHKLIEERIYGREGDVVRIKAGPFSDHNGIIKRLKYDQSRITLSVAFLGASVDVELDSAMVEKF